MSPSGPDSQHPDNNEVVFDSTDPERTEVFLDEAFGVRVKVSGYDENYRFRLVRLGSGPVQLNTIDHTATTEIDAQPVPANLIVVRMHRGVRTHVDLDDYLGPGDVALNSQPGHLTQTRATSVRQTTVHVPMQAAADAARNRPDDDLRPLSFDSLRPPRPADARRWLQTIEYITENLRADPDAMTQPLLSGAATRLIAATLLATFPNTWTTEPTNYDRTDASPTTLTRAISFIDTNVDLDITVTDIARAAYVTVRAVQLAFRRYLDTTPMAYLRRVRLARAHEQLRAADPHDGITVSHVAARWGFVDASRFTALYRRTYGQPPSQTLRT